MSKRTKFHQAYLHRTTGKPVPGSTTILKNIGWSSEVLIGWARNLGMKGLDPFKVRDDAAEIGTVAHEMIETHLSKEYGIGEFEIDLDDYAPVLVEKAQLAFDAYMKWENGLKEFEPLESEIQLAHYDLLYGGTIDMIAKINGVLHIVDFKTSKYVYPTHVMQAESYRQMYLSNMPDVDKDIPVLILHISKSDGRCTPYTYEAYQLEPAWEAFNHALALHYLKDLVPGG